MLVAIEFDSNLATVHHEGAMPKPLNRVFPPARKNHTHHTECKILQSVSEQYILSSLHAPACMAFCPPCPKAVKDLASVQPVPSGSHLVRLIAHCVPAK